MQTASKRNRQRLLDEAFEQGIRHFDVARMYGLGAAERELGRFARGRRDRISIATKFGIDPAGVAGRLAALQTPARAVIARLPALRARLKRRDGSFHRARRYDPASARVSLETSLRQLGTDYVDILFIHDPGSVDRDEMAELAETLEEMRGAGYIRAWGVSGEPEPSLELIDAFPGAVLQLRDEIFESALGRVERGTPVITFGVLTGALERIQSLMSDPARRVEWSQAVGQDCGDPQVLASLLLQDALDRNGSGGVVFSTTRAERIGAATGAAEALRGDPRPTSLTAFRERVAGDLVAGRAGNV